MRKFCFYILIILATLTYMLIKQIPANKASLLNHEMPIEQMKKLNIYHYDSNGILKNYTFAASWEFLSNIYISKLQQPYLIIIKEPNFKYVIKANYGQIQHQGLNSNIDLIKLISNVMVQQQLSLNLAPKFTLNTDYLEFNPNTELATTNKKVIIYKPGLIITGTGMEANFKKHQIAITSNVTTEYHKQSYKNKS